MAKEDNFSYKEYLAIGAAVAASIVVSLRIGLSPKWEHGVVFAALLFGVLITALRPIWRERFFWRWLVGSLLGIRPRDIPRLLRAIQSLACLAAAGGLMLVGSIGALAYARRQHELMESAALNKSLDQGPDVRRSDLED